MQDQNQEAVKTIRDILGMAEDDFALPTNEPEDTLVDSVPAPPVELPVPEVVLSEDSRALDDLETVLASPVQEQVPDFEPEVDTSGLLSPMQRIFAKDWVRYPLVFIVALGFFYVLLNSGAIVSQIAGVFSSPDNNQEAVLGDELAEYDSWIQKYYYHVTNPEILAANNDADRDGLTNRDEFRLDTNPLVADTDHDGIDDGAEILSGDNPLYRGGMTFAQQSAVSKYIVLADVNARKKFGSISRVAGQQNSFPIDDFMVDTSVPGRVSIPKIDVDVPLVWTSDFSQVQDDLKYGAVHHPDTPYPGQPGTSSLHGHSSGYLWDGDYKTAFTKLNFLEAGDEVFVTVQGMDGSTRRYRYLVRYKQVYDVDEQEQFEGNSSYNLNLSTSWPIGSARQRLVVHTELAGL